MINEMRGSGPLSARRRGHAVLHRDGHRCNRKKVHRRQGAEIAARGFYRPDRRDRLPR